MGFEVVDFIDAPNQQVLIQVQHNPFLESKLIRLLTMNVQ
jgi:hypothetical protein